MGILDLVPFRHQHPQHGGNSLPRPVDRESDPLSALQSDVDRAFQQFWDFVAFPMPSEMASRFLEAGQSGFNVDVHDKGREIDIVAELPGLTEADIDVSVGPDSVTIRAERKEEHEEVGESTIVRERHYGVLERTIQLPEGTEPDQAVARFKDGILTIAIPKTAEAQARHRKITVRTG